MFAAVACTGDSFISAILITSQLTVIQLISRQIFSTAWKTLIGYGGLFILFDQSGLFSGLGNFKYRPEIKSL